MKLVGCAHLSAISLSYTGSTFNFMAYQEKQFSIFLTPSVNKQRMKKMIRMNTSVEPLPYVATATGQERHREPE